MRAVGVLNERSRSNAAFSEAEKRRYADTTNRSLPGAKWKTRSVHSGRVFYWPSLAVTRSRADLLRSTASCALRKPQCCFAGAARCKI